MSFDLDLLFLNGPDVLDEKIATCHDRLRFDGDSYFFHLIQDGAIIKNNPLPPSLSIRLRSEEGDYQIRLDAGGHLLTFVYAGDFNRLPFVEMTRKNQAILAYIKGLCDDTPIVLYWN